MYVKRGGSSAEPEDKLMLDDERRAYARVY